MGCDRRGWSLGFAGLEMQAWNPAARLRALSFGCAYPLSPEQPGADWAVLAPGAPLAELNMGNPSRKPCLS